MICCVGLFVGIYVGQYLGGFWIFLAPAAGFGLGLVFDMKFMHAHHGGDARHGGDGHDGHETKVRTPHILEEPKQLEIPQSNLPLTEVRMTPIDQSD